MSGHKLMRDDHWVMLPGENETPEPPANRPTRDEVQRAARYAIRAATANGTILDFDPDALVIELKNALCGYGANLTERAR